MKLIKMLVHTKKYMCDHAICCALYETFFLFFFGGGGGGVKSISVHVDCAAVDSYYICTCLEVCRYKKIWSSCL